MVWVRVVVVVCEVQVWVVMKARHAARSALEAGGRAGRVDYEDGQLRRELLAWGRCGRW